MIRERGVAECMLLPVCTRVYRDIRYESASRLTHAEVDSDTVSRVSNRISLVSSPTGHTSTASVQSRAASRPDPEVSKILYLYIAQVRTTKY